MKDKVLYWIEMAEYDLETGKVIFMADYNETFEVFMKTIRDFDAFKPRLDLYYSSLGV